MMRSANCPQITHFLQPSFRIEFRIFDLGFVSRLKMMRKRKRKKKKSKLQVLF
ncbi:hypothetical protein Hanom_Chr05g00473101 [Helianthus anomalus]